MALHEETGRQPGGPENLAARESGFDSRRVYFSTKEVYHAIALVMRAEITMGLGYREGPLENENPDNGGRTMPSNYDYWRLAEEDVPPRLLHAGPDDDDEEDDEDDEEETDEDE